MSSRFCNFLLTPVLIIFVVWSFSVPALGAEEAEAPAPKNKSYLINKVAAVVNGEMISLFSVQNNAMQEISRRGFTGNSAEDAKSRQQIFNNVLGNMINDVLIHQEAERYKIVVKEEEVENEVRMVMSRSGLDAKQFEDQLILQGSSTSQFREEIRINILRQRLIGMMVARKVQISDEEVREYYDSHYDIFNIESGVDVSMIAFPPSVNAANVLKDIKAGKTSFEEAALQFSTAPSARNGGRLGIMNRKDLNQQWKTALDALSPGGVSGIVQNGNVEFLLKLNARIESAHRSFEEAAPEIEQMLRQPLLADRFEEYTEELRRKAVIDIRL